VAVYHPAARAMLESIDVPVKTIDAGDIEFVQMLYDGKFDDASRLLERYKEIYGEDALHAFYSGDSKH